MKLLCSSKINLLLSGQQKTYKRNTHGPLTGHEIVKNCLGRRWAPLSREAPDCTGGFTPGIDLIDTPEVRSTLNHCAGVECCSSLIPYERRRH
ncbi:hypothetical protein ES703_44482 [subsurface metagenome]